MDKTRDVFPGKIEPHVAETWRDFFTLDSVSFGILRGRSTPAAKCQANQNSVEGEARRKTEGKILSLVFSASSVDTHYPQERAEKK